MSTFLGYTRDFRLQLLTITYKKATAASAEVEVKVEGLVLLAGARTREGIFPNVADYCSVF